MVSVCVFALVACASGSHIVNTPVNASVSASALSDDEVALLHAAGAIGATESKDIPEVCRTKDMKAPIAHIRESEEDLKGPFLQCTAALDGVIGYVKQCNMANNTHSQRLCEFARTLSRQYLQYKALVDDLKENWAAMTRYQLSVLQREHERAEQNKKQQEEEAQEERQRQQEEQERAAKEKEERRHQQYCKEHKYDTDKCSYCNEHAQSDSKCSEIFAENRRRAAEENQRLEAERQRAEAERQKAEADELERKRQAKLIFMALLTAPLTRKDAIRSCVQCCLAGSESATRDHCEAACNDDTSRYMNPSGTCK